MTYRARSEGRRVRRERVRVERERRKYTRWRRLLWDAEQPVPDGLTPEANLIALWEREMNATIAHMMRRVDLHMYRPYLESGWESWEDRGRPPGSIRTRRLT